MAIHFFTRSIHFSIPLMKKVSGLLLIHLRTAASTSASEFQASHGFAMTSLKFTVVPHPPYSPDLAPSDFWLFPNLKEKLKGQHFLSDAEVDAAVRKWISSKPETFFINGMEKWIERVKKCMAINGDYVENKYSVWKRIKFPTF